jgi:hypothetical protein
MPHILVCACKFPLIIFITAQLSSKAFDTLSHNFVSQVYKFFNLGPNIIKWLNLLGNNREACISLGNGLDTPFFRLGRGRPQGDNPSPNTFNFSVQILIQDGAGSRNRVHPETGPPVNQSK